MGGGNGLKSHMSRERNNAKRAAEAKGMDCSRKNLLHLINFLQEVAVVKVLESALSQKLERYVLYAELHLLQQK
jgi:uridylate kinase